MQPIATNAIRLWFAVALCLLLNGVPNLAAIPDEQFLYAGLASIAGPFLGRIFLMVSARYVEARLTTLANLTTPVMTLVLAYLLLGDWPTAYQMLGGAIMIAGIGVPLIRPARSALEQKTS
jgi:drug/metabolite transporter (DMT)-like permease